MTLPAPEHGGSSAQPDWYFIHSETIARVNAYLSLPARGGEQDWEIELADARRWEEFFQILVEHRLANDPEMETAVAALLIGSIDLALNEEVVSSSELESVAAFFQENPILRDCVRRIWCIQSMPLHEEIIAPWLVPDYQSPGPIEESEPPPPPNPGKPWYKFW